jgi:hypothetical protein
LHSNPKKLYAPEGSVNGRSINILPAYKISSLKITLPKTLQLKTLDFLQQTNTMKENAQWQMIKDSVLFALEFGIFRSRKKNYCSSGVFQVAPA